MLFFSLLTWLVAASVGTLLNTLMPLTTLLMPMSLFQMHAASPLIRRAESGFCYVPSYGRGVGKPIHTCPCGMEQDAGLCYTPCASNYRGAGPMCHEVCAPGYTDDGLTCRRPWPINVYGKKGYGRGAGQPLGCGPNEDYDAGLCYPKCKAGYRGIGPVCYGTCNTQIFPSACGVGCAMTPHDCAKVVVNQVSSELSLALNLAIMFSGLGSITKPIALAAASTIANSDVIETAKNKIADALAGTQSLTPAQASHISSQVVDAAQQGGNFKWNSVDPIGLGALLKAFNHPICPMRELPEPLPNTC